MSPTIFSQSKIGIKTGRAVACSLMDKAYSKYARKTMVEPCHTRFEMYFRARVDQQKNQTNILMSRILPPLVFRHYWHSPHYLMGLSTRHLPLL